MTDSRKRICRYFNTVGGCWYGDCCRFLHIPNKKPPCIFYDLSTGCRYGESCHFAHDRTPLKSVENYDNNGCIESIKDILKANMTLKELTGTNNNDMTRSVLNGKQEKTVENVSDLVQDKNNANAIGKHDRSIQNVSINLDEDSTEFESLNVSTTSNLIGTNETSHFESTPCTACGDDPSVKTDDALNYVCNVDKASTDQAVKENSQNHIKSAVSGHSQNLHGNEMHCGSCRQVLVNSKNESYCTVLKNHYLDCFLDKGDHVKYVKIRAALEPGQIFWCKSCILIFEKPWSLFQHMADKAKGSKIQQLEKKLHFDWLDNVAGLMAGYDLGLFSPTKLGIDLRNLLTDQHVAGEELEAAAVTTAALMQWLTLLISSWRLKQRESMRRVEQFNRQMLRRVNRSLNTGYSICNARAVLPTTRIKELDKNVEIVDTNNTNSALMTSILNNRHVSGFHGTESKRAPAFSNDSSICRSKIPNILSQ
ncbi:unnamed protein product [Schistosoma turkestanicum]|nr:unnamed protein product [Schistosoma turkestanicum]